MSNIPDMSSKLVTVFGGSGFVGRSVVGVLTERGYRVRVAVRRPDLAHYLQPMGTVGQIQLVQANLRYPQSVLEAAKGADVVVNLVGILAESGRQGFDSVQAEGARTVAMAAKGEGASMVQMSAIGADEASDANYARTKAEGEQAVLDIVKRAVILRPSIVFGPRDDFFNRFGKMARIAPFLPLIGGGTTRFQPVYVGDVAEAVARAVDGKAKGGTVYELGGPEIVTFRQCLERLLKHIHRKRALVSLPWFLAAGMGRAFGWLPGAPITEDQVKLLQSDNVVSQEAVAQKRTLEGLGIEPTAMDAVLPSYLVQYRPSGQFTKPDVEEV